jgi:GNAT superfamily N-acetyltransferase
MSVLIRPYEQRDYDRVVDTCVRAFTPIHEGFAAEMGPRIFALEFPDWRGGYAQTLAKPLEAGAMLHVAELDGEIAGFVATIAHARKMGEIGLNAVAPEHQGKGVGRAMYVFALGSLKARGCVAAYVGTGGDAAHEPARRAYEAMGFDKVIPGLHFYKEL